MIKDQIVKNLLTPIERFLKLQSSSGIVLILSALLALVMANSPLSSFYNSLLYTPVGIGIGSFFLEMTLHHWVNDGLMVIFFFVVGLEIKRELSIGTLSSKSEALLPFVAALGGMIIPALIYITFNYSQESVIGWGIPMATDIAFAVGILAFVSRHIPFALKIFLLAVATIDDLGAILVIAFFYSTDISGFWISLAGLVTFVTFCFKQMRVNSYLVYSILGIILWYFIYQTGIHATITGVILGLMAPVRHLNVRKSKVNEKLQSLIQKENPSTYEIERTKRMLRDLQSPAQFLIDRLHLFVSFFVMPAFAFFNSGLYLGSGLSFSEVFSNSIFKGVFLGLLIGKPLGVFLFSWLAVKIKWANWPSLVTPQMILGAGFLSGIGFTMSLFISHLSLSFNDSLETYSKSAIFLASLIAGLIGYFILRCQKRL